jgi:hypothetical protein
VLPKLMWILAAVALVLGIFYLIPGMYHPLTTSDAMASHVKHAIVFFGLAVVLFVGGRFVANSQPA